MSDTRPAQPDDVRTICLSFPEVELMGDVGDRPAFAVRRGSKTHSFCASRAPRGDAINPATGERYEDLLVIWVPDPGAKAALVDDPTLPFFTVDHFNGYNAVLVQESRLGELTVTELTEILTDAWGSRAPRRLVAAWEAQQRGEA